MIYRNTKDIKNKLRPLLNNIGFTETKKNCIFKSDQYSVRLYYETIFGVKYCKYCLYFKEGSKYNLLSKTYYIDEFIKNLHDNKYFLRKIKIKNLLNI